MFYVLECLIMFICYITRTRSILLVYVDISLE